MEIKKRKNGFCLVPETGKGTGYCMTEDGGGYYVRPVDHNDKSTRPHYYCCWHCGGEYPHGTEGDGNYLLFKKEKDRLEAEIEERDNLCHYRQITPFYQPTIMEIEEDFRKRFHIPYDVNLSLM